MATTQDDRLMAIYTPLGKDYLLINRFTATEGISELFTIEAELWAQPLPLRLFLRTDVDLETGSVVVTEAARTD